MGTATLHIVTGQTGAGKTTYARALAERESALLLAIDDWMGRLFWADALDYLGTWAHERVARCTAQMREVLGQTLPLGLPAVADWAEARSIAVRLHWIDLDAATRWARVQARNAAGGGGTGFVVTRAMFDYMEDLWQAPTAAEMARLGARIT
ncbi:MAG: AAA family ATPase [Pseudomonadota bacterium]